MKKIFSLLLLSLTFIASVQAEEKSVEQAALNVVSGFLKAVQQGDQAGLKLFLDPDVVWHEPGNNRFSGVQKGRAAALAMIGGMYEVSQGSLQLSEIKWLTANGNQVAALLHFKANRPGATMEINCIDVYTVKNGKIVGLRTFTDDQKMEDAFFGSKAK